LGKLRTVNKGKTCDTRVQDQSIDAAVRGGTVSIFLLKIFQGGIL